MKRYRQTLEELLNCLSDIDASWQDDHAMEVIAAIAAMGDKLAVSDVEELLAENFRVGSTVIQLVLDLSKDKFAIALQDTLGPGGKGVNRFQRDTSTYLNALEKLGVVEKLQSLTTKPVTWRDILFERLKSGRGSAIKGQARGRILEDFTENIVKRIFEDVGYDVRCSFIGAGGTSSEKADFAIPSKEDPSILIESKAYGATGSKQTDILGDITRIVDEKRHDTHLLLITDGVTWRHRSNDLRKLVTMQHEGRIARIYTSRMETELEEDLRQLREDHGL